VSLLDFNVIYGINSNDNSPDDPAILDLLNLLRTLEIRVGVASYLLHKLPLQFDMVNRLIMSGMCRIRDGIEKETVFDLFVDGSYSLYTNI
jgi:hypothetical protein